LPTVPRIGITWGPDRGADGEPFDTPDAYVRAVERAGGDAVLLESSPSRVASQLEGLGGVLLSGGQDVAPEWYGGERTAAVQPANEARDAFEVAVAKAARERGLPLLGICRGLQIANVAFGGTLIEDLPPAGRGDVLDHRGRASDGHERTGIDPEHVVLLEPGTLLARVLGLERVATNSLHHQGARVMPSDLREAGMTRDGVIEALEATFAHPFFVLVQWHPELLDDDASQRLFAAFVEAAGVANSARLEAT